MIPVDQAERRLWARTKKTRSGCWIWQGAKTPQGYGVLHVNGSNRLAHRVAYALSRAMAEMPKRTVTNDAVVRHTCANRACINPDHLRLGTQAENMRDMLLHRNRAIGFRNPMTKLTDEAVREMREHGGTIEGRANLMLKYGVTETHIRLIYERKKRKHVPD